MRSTFLPLTVALMFVVSACGNRGDFSDEGFAEDAKSGEVVANEADRYAIHSSGGEVKMGLTDEHVYFRLSDETLAEIERDMKRDTENEEGLGGAIAGAVTRGVSDLLRHRLQYRVEEIRDLHYDEGAFRIEFEDGSYKAPEMQSGDSGTPLFEDAEAQRFIEAFRDLKGTR